MVASLRDQLDEANETIRQFRNAMAASPLIRYRGLRLSRSERCILEALLNANGLLSKHQLRHAIDAELTRIEAPDLKSVDVVVCRLRKRLRPFSVVISTEWGRGYYLDLDARATLLSLRYSTA
jgi:two-component system cell cycle response regulator CtrA